VGPDSAATRAAGATSAMTSDGRRWAHDHRRGGETPAGFAQRLGRTREENGVGRGEGARIGRNGNRRRKLDARQIIGVDAHRDQLGSVFGATRHESDRVTETGEVDREGGPPGAGAGDDKIHAVGLTAKPAEYTKKESGAATFSRIPSATQAPLGGHPIGCPQGGARFADGGKFTTE